MTRFLAILLLVILFSPVSAQWGGRAACAVAQEAVVTQQQVKLEWFADRSATGQIDLMSGPKMIGAYDTEAREFRRLVNYSQNIWSAPEPIPEQAPPLLNFGVNLEAVKEHADGFSICGKPCTKEEAYYYTKHGIPDDKGKQQITVIGDEADTKGVYEVLVAANIHNEAVVRLLPDDHWQLRDNDDKLLFQVDDKVNIYIQDESGKVIHRQDDDKDIVTAVRKAKPYEPEKDKDIRTDISLPGVITNLPPVAIVGGGVALVALFLRKKNNA